MKIRDRYVSNSSTSSFILCNAPILSKLTADDWREMLRDLYNGYDKYMQEQIDNGEEPTPPFEVFDLSTEREAACEELGGYLRGWIASNVTLKNGVCRMVKRDISNEWSRFNEELEYDIVRHYATKLHTSLSVYTNTRSRKSIKDSSIGFWTEDKNGKSIHKEMKLDKLFTDMMEAKWDELGLCDNFDILKSDISRFAIHFDENEVGSIKNFMVGKGKRFETEGWSYERLCEIIAKWLIKHKKVPSEFSWRNLMDYTLTYNMHEG